MMAGISREKIASRIKLIKYGGAAGAGPKLAQLRRLRDELSAVDSVLILEFISPILGLLSDHLSPVRKFITQMIGEIGLRHLELLPEIVPALVDVLKDDTPAVARQAIKCGIDIFRFSLVKVAIQGLYSSEFNESLRSAWTCVLKFRDEIYSMAFKVGSDGRRLAALKFVESVVLLYTPDPNGSLEPPSDQISEGKFEEFNVSWLRGGHPMLNVRDLSAEASRSLGLLLDQLRFPSLKSHSYLVILVLIKSLSAVATKRPVFYGRILPVLLGLDPSSSAGKAMHLAGVHHALKNAFESCLNCTHPGAAPWGDRLVNALKEIKVGKTTEKVANEISDNNGRAAGDSHVAQIHEDQKPTIAFVTENSNANRKRAGVLDSSEFTEDDMGGKRARSTNDNSEGPGNGMSEGQDRIPSSEPTPLRSDADNGPVQQLVAMFGALVAQGEKAVVSLEILISSISADLLAEVVMANMRNLPPKSPKSEGDEELLGNMADHPDIIGSDTHIKHLSLLLTDLLSQSKSSPVEETGIEDPHHSLTLEEEEPRLTLADSNVAYDDLSYASQQSTVHMSESVSPKDNPSAMETGFTSITSEVNDIEGVSNEIPGLALSTQDDGLPENAAVLSKGLTDLDDANQEKFTNLARSSIELDGLELAHSLPSPIELAHPLSSPIELAHSLTPTELAHSLSTPTELAHSLSADRSEELSPKATIMDTNSMSSSTATSVGLSSQLVLPKISAPIIYLGDEQKDQLQQLAFVRIVDAYKQVTVAGGSQVRFSILAHSGMEFPLELDPWKLLKAHILSDYVNHEGHELTLRVLYRLFGEAEEDRDFFSSTTATSVYETFLLQVAETLRDFFPASDKSLSRLLGEVPYLPKSIFEMLERLCSPGTSDNDDKELHGGDRVTQGLSTVWSLMLLRPPIRDACLKIALKILKKTPERVLPYGIRPVSLFPSLPILGFTYNPYFNVVKESAVHHLEEVRMKAIRLVANKLYPLSSLSEKIEDFAKEMLLSVLSDDQIALTKEADGIHAELQKDDNPSSENQPVSSAVKEISPDGHQFSASEKNPSSTMAEVQRCMSLYFALCTKAVHRQIPLLVRTIGSSRALLDIISEPPNGSEGLVTQVVHTLTDGTVPSPELVSTIKRLYDTKIKDVDVLIPILPFLPKDEVLLLFPNLVNAPLDKFQVVLSRVLQGLNHSTPVLTPAEALIAIHGIDPERDGIPLKKAIIMVTDACNACFEQRQIFSQQVLAKVLNQLVEQIPLPLLFMRTVLQAIGAFPSLVEFIMEILSRLVSKQIWKYPKLWVGFMKCALLTKPESFGVLLQLPTAQLENALNRTSALKAPLIAHASQPHIRSSLPRSTLMVLGLVSEPQTSTPIQPTQAQTEASNSEKEAVTDKSKESSTAS
ncbi:hypothetical protein DH2020_045953 [Rehmannia glutinosa]|uniref:Symplekin n=1 Tax=Rehmannia glutinosa TaxID=99300 RepID=A0ABR0UCL1_REHGL